MVGAGFRFRGAIVPIAGFDERRLVIGEAAIAGLLLVAFLLERDLPMVDLPQHAAQLALWLNFGNPEYHTDQFVLNLRTPYLMAPLVARLLATAFGVMIALKLVVWLAVVGQVLGLHFLCKRLGHDPWLALLGLPLALGYTFLFGFVSYVVALPLIFLCIGLAMGYAACPSLGRGTLLIATLMAVLVSHGFAFAQTLLFVGPLLIFGKGTIGWRALPLLVPISAAAAWLMPNSAARRLGVDLWELTFSRLISLPAMLVGSGAQDIIAVVYGSLLLLLLGLAVGPPVRTLGRLLPGAFVVLGFCTFPEVYRGYPLLWPRFAMLVVPATLLAFRPRTDVSRFVTFRRRTTLLAAAAVWTGLFAFRLSEFNRETSHFHNLIDALPRGLRVRPIVFDTDSHALPGLPAFTHLPAYYLVEKGGIQGYSFAMYPQSVVRYRDGIIPKMHSGEEWRPEEFRIDEELSDYDCFIVHSKQNRFQELFGALHDAVELRAHAGDWWSYCSPEKSPISWHYFRKKQSAGRDPLTHVIKTSDSLHLR